MEESRSAQVEKEYMIQHFGTDPSFLIEDICEDFKVKESFLLPAIGP